MPAVTDATPATDPRAWALTRTATLGCTPRWDARGDATLTAPSDARPASGGRPADPAVPPIVGGRYHLDLPIGKGGFGRVWRATDALTRDTVAVKLCAAGDATAASLVRDEVTALQWAGLPGIVRLRDDGFEGTTAFLVMDLVEGTPFPGRAPVPLVEITTRLLEVIARLHGIGVFHGDIKPANVLVDAAGNPTVLDLGIARGGALRVGDAPCDYVTHRYAAPEQLAEGRVDAQSDLYSVGVMLDEAAEALGEPLDGALARLVIALTRPDRRRRPASAAAALTLLGGALDAAPPLAPAPDPAALMPLFTGPEAFLHHRSEAARVLWSRSGGRPDAMRRELAAWLRAGFAWREGDAIALRAEGLARLVDGYPVAVDHPQPALPDAAADLLCWIRLAQPLAGVDRLRAVVAMAPEAFTAALDALRAAGAVWTLPDGTLGTWVQPDPAPGWPLDRLQQAHAALAASLPEGSAAAVRHAIAADYTAPGLSERIAAVGRRLVLDGCLREAQALLAVGLDLARARDRADDEALLLPVAVMLALAGGGPDAIRHARYLVGRAMTRTPRIEQLERLLTAGLAGTPERGRALLDAVGPLDDEDLERLWHMLAIMHARREGIDAEVRAVDDCGAWAARDPAWRRADHLYWLGELRYRQGRYADAAGLHAESSRLSVGTLRTMAARIAEAAAWLEAFEMERAMDRAREVGAMARTLRHVRVELSAVFIERSACYRLARLSPPHPDHVDAAALLGPMPEALIAASEAVLAWRSGAPGLARTLASRAARRLGEEGRVEAAAVYRALALHCGEPFEPAEQQALITFAEGAHEPDFGLQIFGLMAFTVPPGQLAARARACAARGRPPSQWHHRLDVLSYHEALTSTGAEGAPDPEE